MNLLAFVVCICWLSLGITCTARAQGIGCVDYAPDQSDVARTILEGTGASYLLMAENLAVPTVYCIWLTELNLHPTGC